jgi:hypothetical protein
MKIDIIIKAAFLQLNKVIDNLFMVQISQETNFQIN